MKEISIVINTQNHVEQHSQSKTEEQFLNQHEFLETYSDKLQDLGVTDPHSFWDELVAHRTVLIGVKAAEICVKNARLLVHGFDYEHPPEGFFITIKGTVLQLHYDPTYESEQPDPFALSFPSDAPSDADPDQASVTTGLSPLQKGIFDCFNELPRDELITASQLHRTIHAFISDVQQKGITVKQTFVDALRAHIKPDNCHTLIDDCFNPLTLIARMHLSLIHI